MSNGGGTTTPNIGGYPVPLGKPLPPPRPQIAPPLPQNAPRLPYRPQPKNPCC